jgi:hypothetical protein
VAKIHRGVAKIFGSLRSLSATPLTKTLKPPLTERLLNIEDSFKNSVLHHAAIKDNLDVTKLILNYGKVIISKANMNER